MSDIDSYFFRVSKFKRLSDAISGLSYCEMMKVADDIEHTVRTFEGEKLTDRDYADILSRLARSVAEEINDVTEKINNTVANAPDRDDEVGHHLYPAETKALGPEKADLVITSPSPGYVLTPVEYQSGLSRIKLAEMLIGQLPPDHDGRNTWLLNYGVGEEACKKREIRRLKFNTGTQACECTSEPAKDG